MKKLALILALLLTFAMVLAACDTQPLPTDPTGSSQPSQTDPKPSETDPKPSVEPGTVFNCIDNFNFEEGQNGVWQYYFSGDSGATYDPCGGYHDYGGGIEGWHPWEGSYIGVGFNADVEGFLELNTDCYSTDYSGQMGVLCFEAPADGKYVLTAAVWNPWEQYCQKFTFKHSDGTILYEQDMTDLVAIYGYITPTDVQLKAGDRIYMYLNAAGSEWVSGYINATIYYEPTDDSCYEVPEVEIPEDEPPFDPTKDAQYSAYAQFDQTDANGTNVPWVYGWTADGVTFNAPSYFDAPNWDDDAEPDAYQWYSDNYTGVGINVDCNNWLEINTPGQGSEMCFVGFKAPAAGTYVLSGWTINMWGQDAEGFRVVLNGEEVATLEFLEEATEFNVEVTLAEGEVVYIHPVASYEGGWVSGYIALYADQKKDADYSATAEFDTTDCNGANGPWVYGWTADGVAFESASYFDSPDWTGDGNPDAHQWYTDNGTGLGLNLDCAGWLEVNTPGAGSEAAALGFQAPAAGTYVFSGETCNLWEQDAAGFRVVLNGEEVTVLEYVAEATEFSFELTLAEGDVVYFHPVGAYEGGWVSGYIDLYVDVK